MVYRYEKIDFLSIILGNWPKHRLVVTYRWITKSFHRVVHFCGKIFPFSHPTRTNFIHNPPPEGENGVDQQMGRHAGRPLHSRSKGVRFRRSQPSITTVFASPNGAWQSPGRQFVILRSTRRFPRSLCSLGMTDLGDRAFVWAGRFREVRRWGQTAPYKVSPLTRYT